MLSIPPNTVLFDPSRIVVLTSKMHLQEVRTHYDKMVQISQVDILTCGNCRGEGIIGALPIPSATSRSLNNEVSRGYRVLSSSVFVIVRLYISLVYFLRRNISIWTGHY